MEKLVRSIDMRTINEIGNRYGMLAVVERAENPTSRGGAYWLCRCDCSNVKAIRGTSLRNGNAKSCGCRQGKNHGLPHGESMFNVLYNKYVWGATGKRNFEWSISKEQFRHLTKQNCQYCGCEPSREQTAQYCNGTYIYNGLDRVDNSKGYTIDNVVPCCTTCNLAKVGMTVKEFYRWVESVSENAYWI